MMTMLIYKLVGFLNLETDDVPGNVGLMDQVAALKWVNQLYNP